jgi:hypothetical protein
LWGVPLTAVAVTQPWPLALALWGMGFLLSVALHYQRNRRLERERHWESLTEMIAHMRHLESLGLDRFGREGTIQTRPVSAMIAKRDSMLLAPHSRNPIELETEIIAALRSQPDWAPKQLTVLLPHAMGAVPADLAWLATAGVRFVTEVQASDVDFLQRELAVPTKRAGGKLKFLLYPNARPADPVMTALLTVAREDEADNLVQFVLLNVLEQDAWAIQTGWRAVEDWFATQHVVDAQA